MYIKKETNKNETKPLDKKGGEKVNTQPVITPQSLRGLLVGMLIISFIVGGLSGVIFSAWVNTDSAASAWIKQNIFGQTKAHSVDISSNSIIKVNEDSATIDVVKKVSPAVVSIVVTQDLSKVTDNTFPFNDFFQFNFPFQYEAPEGNQEVGAGTGFIISEDGLIVTNKHVVDTADAEYTVVMNDGQQYTAEVLDTDPFNDIALIQIGASDLPCVELGDSDSLQIGQTVIAIGNTLGEYSNTVTRGVISGLSRTITAGDSQGKSETLEDIIQTDAAINFGNSGGPLLNLAGQVIGVNTAISQEGQLVGFAIPMNQAKKAIESVQQHGRIVRPYLGVRYILLDKTIAEKNNLSVDHGALIVRGEQASDLAVIPGSPADKAGLEENDIILEINGEPIDEEHNLASRLSNYDPDQTVTLKVLHDGQEKTVEAVLGELED